MAAFQLINRTKNYLREHAEANWYQSYRIKESGTDTYCHDLNGLDMIIRVNFQEVTNSNQTNMYGFYWLYNMNDVHLLIQYVHEQLKLEAHEIIVKPTIKLFYDIDMQLTQTDLTRMIDYYGEYSGEYDLDINDVARHLANLYFDATLASLVEHGNDLEQLQMSADMMYTSRNRAVNQSKYKLSIHVITNIVCSIEQCRAVVEDVKNNILHNPQDHDLDYDEASHELIINAIDVQPYHKLGSLAITGGRKVVDGVEHVNELQQSFQLHTEEPFITRIDVVSNKINFSQYPVTISYSGDVGGVVSPEFVKQVYEYIHKVPYFNHSDWDLEAASYKGCVAIIRRVHPSFCAICERQHDLDNTLMIVFNEERGTGAWKCLRARDVKAKVFYRDDRVDADVEQFASQLRVLPKYNTIDSVEPIVVPQGYSEEPEVAAEATKVIIEGSDDEQELAIECLSESDHSSESSDPSESDHDLMDDDNRIQMVDHLSDSDESDTPDAPNVSSKIIVEAPDQPINLSIPMYDGSESDDSDSEISIVSDEFDDELSSESDSDEESAQLAFDEGYESDTESYNANQLLAKPELPDSSSALTVSGVLRYAKKNTFVL
jgi:hypothetical protein